MKVGDLVKLKTSLGCPLGVITGIDQCGWFVVLQADGRTCLWPGQEMEKINEV